MTATKRPSPSAHRFPPASKDISTQAFLPSIFDTRAVTFRSVSIGVGLSRRTLYEAVTVQGGSSSSLASMSDTAAAQFPWQSSKVPMIPPFTMPGKAWWCGSGRKTATNSSPSR